MVTICNWMLRPAANRWSAHLVPICVYAIAYYILTFPALNTFGTRFLCDGGDGPQNMWNLWWVKTAVYQLRSPWFTDYLFYPDGISLIGATLNPFNGFIGIPLSWVFNQVQVYNLIVVFSYVATGYFTFLLVRELTKAYWPSIFGGAALTFCSFHMAHGYGHMQLVSLEWLPFFFYAWIRLLREPSQRRAILAAVALFLVLLCDYYYTLCCVGGGACILAYGAWQAKNAWCLLRRDQVLPLIAFTGTCVVLCGPLVLGLVLTNATDPFVGAHQELFFLNDLLGPFIPGPNWKLKDLTEWFWGSLDGWYQNRTEFSNWIGPMVLLACAYALAIAKRQGIKSELRIWFWIGALFYAVSLGPVLHIHGKEFSAVPMPYNGLKVVFPPLAMSGCPIRLSVMYLLSAAVIASYGVAHFFSSGMRRKLCILPFLALFGVELMPLHQPTLDPRVPGVVRRLSNLPHGAVLGFDWDNRSVWYQVVCGKPMEHGYVARYPESVFAYGVRMQRLAEEGHYKELIKEGQGRYLVRTKSQIRPKRDMFKLIYSDFDHDLYVLKTDPLARSASPKAACGASPLPRIQVEQLGLADHTMLEIRAPFDSGRRYLCAFSAARVRPMELGNGNVFELALDPVLQTALLQGNTVFLGNRGILDERGHARVRVDTAYLKHARNSEIFYSVVLLEEGQPYGVCRVSKPQRLWLQAR